MVDSESRNVVVVQASGVSETTKKEVLFAAGVESFVGISELALGNFGFVLSGLLVDVVEESGDGFEHGWLGGSLPFAYIINITPLACLVHSIYT